MGQRTVHNTHRWGQDMHCKGCKVSMNDAKAQKPCEQPYKPRARLAKEKRKP